ncbi:MAG: beta-galactosidase [bacterium]|nr:beta-galactosidase [bacterium]
MRKLLFFFGLFLIALWFLTRPVPVPADIAYGVTFSIPYARDTLALDWKKTYAGILDELKARHLRLPAYWTEIEKERGKYDFSGLDYLVGEAGKRNAEIILAVGEKLPRWPECFVPDWAGTLSREERHKVFLNFIDRVIERYRGDKHIVYWQVENEPFLPFGGCTDYDKYFVDVEISRVKSLDSRPVIVTDSGELSLWAQAYKRADVFGTTMYRTVSIKFIENFKYPLPPGYFRMKARLMRYIFGEKPIIVVELQAEPWTKKRPPEVSIDTQMKLMNVGIFKDNINYEKETGFGEVYLWGVEWWYWLKEKHGKPELWDEAKKLFNGGRS